MLSEKRYCRKYGGAIIFFPIETDENLAFSLPPNFEQRKNELLEIFMETPNAATLVVRDLEAWADGEEIFLPDIYPGWEPRHFQELLRLLAEPIARVKQREREEREREAEWERRRMAHHALSEKYSPRIIAAITRFKDYAEMRKFYKDLTSELRREGREDAEETTQNLIGWCLVQHGKKTDEEEWATALAIPDLCVFEDRYGNRVRFFRAEEVPQVFEELRRDPEFERFLATHRAVLQGVRNALFGTGLKN